MTGYSTTSKEERIINLQEAEKFLATLDEDGVFTFVTIEEPKPENGTTKTSLHHGTFEDCQSILCEANSNGHGVFFTVNRTDGKGRKKENILGIRALFVDLDGADLEPVMEAPLSPHIIIESSPGRFHAYWIVESVPMDQFSVFQKNLAHRFGGDGSVNDLPRLMRLPGFYHLKGEPFQSHIIECSGELPYSFDQFQSVFVIQSSNERQQSRTHEPIVLKKLHEAGLALKEEEPSTGRWLIRCPWANEHTGGSDHAYYYSKPSKEYSGEGFKCFHDHCKHRDIRALRFSLGLTPVEGAEPMPLYREVPPPTPFPIEALGSVLAPIALELFETIKAPLAVVAQSLLGAASLAAQGHAILETVDGRTIALSLFLITVAESGERKSAIDDIVLSPILDWQALLCNVYREEFKAYEQQLELWTEEKKRAKANAMNVMDLELEPEPEQPIKPIIIVEEPTYEGLVKYLEYGQPSVGIFSDEGGRFLGGNAMNKENILKTMTGLSSLWDAKNNKPITRIRSGDKSLALYGRRCALHLMIQESVFAKLNENSMCETQGFLPRCLISFPDSMAGQRMYVHRNPKNLPGFQEFKERCNELLNQKYISAPPPAPQNQLEPPAIRLSEEAHQLYVEFHDECEKQFSKDGKYYNIRRFGSKAAEHLLRVAGVIALFENPSLTMISHIHIERGIAIINYYLRERLRLDSYYSVDPLLLTAQKVLDWAQRKGKKGVTLRDLYQYGPPDVRSRDKALEVLRKLEEHGRAFPVPVSEIEEGAKGKAWRFVWPVD